ncbi:Transcriptional regulator ClgR [Corynebacterium capitovis DSM 44611]|uniref:helix-turn-helix domain-containing protein n=1 Tax=Corynebacterium capitovis TaxID=131081 RepID=UPI00037E1803|nr:helix-turn-helix transcriptional regulator [Corynebacterium capitovis]WKD57496.1 Transcriptional regulator ClgR [Corynebacterium capitovis DSM 44611]
MATTTLLLDKPSDLTAGSEGLAPYERAAAPRRHDHREPLLREALGMSLRSFRADKGTSLRSLAAQSRVSPGYLSELERGRKEVSSELLQSICSALETTVAEVMLEAVANMSLGAVQDELEQSVPVRV